MTVFILHDVNNHGRVAVNKFRYDNLMIQLSEQNITDYELFPAIFLHNQPTHFSINASHKAIIRTAKERGLKQCLVFEDDILFTSKGAFDYYIKSIPDDYDIYLGGYYLGVPNGDNTIKEFTAMHCYMVHERFYDTFLSVEDNNHIDAALSGKGKYVICEPIVAVQQNGYSYNSKQYCNFEKMIEHRLVYEKVL
jgi:hypothetical protein